MVYNDVPQNPYDASTQDEEPQTLPFDEIIKLAILAQTMGLRVMMPAKILAKNSTQNVDVQPLFQTRTVSGEVMDLPAIKHVPVSMQQGKNWSIKVSVDVGDTGYIIFSDRSLDAWLAGDGGITDPADSRQHHIKDAVFVPALVPNSEELTDDTTDLIVTNGEAIFKVQRGGTFQLLNSQHEFIDQVDQLANQTKDLANQVDMMAQTLSEDTVNTIFGPMQLNSFETYATIKTSVDNIIEQLSSIISAIETLKGS